MLRTMMKTDDSVASLILRLALAVVMFPHGAQKVLGWWGGAGLSPTLIWFRSIGIPDYLGLLAALTEFLAPLLLALGLLTRLAALGIGFIMLVAVFQVHLANGFFMNWSGTARGEGFEYHLLAMAIALALMLRGGGIFSLDGSLAQKK